MNKALLKARIFALLFILVILGGSSVQGKNIPEAFSLTPDKLIHCLEYAMLGFLLFRWLRLEHPLQTINTISVITFLSGSLMGVIDENYQRLIPGLFPDFWDWVLDSMGVFLAAACMNVIAKRKC